MSYKPWVIFGSQLLLATQFGRRASRIFTLTVGVFFRLNRDFFMTWVIFMISRMLSVFTKITQIIKKSQFRRRFPAATIRPFGLHFGAFIIAHIHPMLAGWLAEFPGAAPPETTEKNAAKHQQT